MPRGFPVFRTRALFAIATLLSVLPAYASRPYAVDDRIVARLRAGAAAGRKVMVDTLPLFDGNPARVTLERFEVWAPDPQIIEYGADGRETRLPRPATKFYRGRIDDDPGSLVFLSVEPGGDISGMALSGDGQRKLSIRRGVRVGPRPPAGDLRGQERESPPLMVREFDEVDDLLSMPQGGFHCDVEGQQMTVARSLSRLKPKPEANTAPSVSTAYGMNLAIETDAELYNAFGSAGAVTTYLGLLIGKASVIYQRDLKTTLTIGTTHLWAGGIASDPWTKLPADGTAAALAEFGAYWHNNYTLVNRSAAVFISGKAFFGGIAWENTLCGTDIFCGADGLSCGNAAFANSYAGPYAFCGSTSITTTVPDPTLTQDTVQYGLPNTADFWMLLELAHELGHNANGAHTHCIPLSVGDKALYGVSRDWVDLCYGGEAGCYSGAVSYPTELGTVMSYCHNLGKPSGYPASRYLFGKAGEPSEKQFPLMTAGLETATPNGAITASASVPCAAGQTASITPANTMAWTITGGTITSGTTGSSITFTPSGPSVVLTCTVANVSGCSLTSQLTIASACAGIAAPANVVATATTATSVSVTWTASGGATMYEVARSLDNNFMTFSTLGTTASTSYPDNTAVAAKAYLYKVRVSAPSLSLYSAPDLATTVVFTDPTLTAGTTVVKAAHFTELRNAVGYVRTLAVLGAYAYTNPAPTAGTTVVKAADLTDLRTALNQARTALFLSAIAYTNPTITAGSSIISAADINDLRNGVK